MRNAWAPHQKAAGGKVALSGHTAQPHKSASKMTFLLHPYLQLVDIQGVTELLLLLDRLPMVPENHFALLQVGVV